MTHHKLTQLTWAVVAVLVLFMGYVRPTFAAQSTVVVGTGSGASCTETAFKTAVNTFGDVVITFNCGSSAQTINLTSQVTVNKFITIDGGGLITLNGGNTTRLFEIPSFGQLALQNITLSQGGGVPSGGAIYNQGTTWLVKVTITNNTACTNTLDVGCGIFNEGTAAIMKIVDSTIKSNSAATGFGGGIAINQGTVELIRSTLESNTAQRGGAISVRNGGTLNARHSTFRNNQTTSGTLDSYRGGAIFVNEAKNVLIEYSTFKLNTAARGGAIYFEALAGSSQTLTLQNSTLNNNTGLGTGGNFGPAGLDLNNGVVTIQNSTFNSNSGKNPSAIFITPDDTTVSIIHSTIAGNLSSINVGGIQKQAPGSSTLTLKNSLLSGNSTINCNSNIVLSNGGGNFLFPTGANGDCGAATGVATSPNVGTLADNGGSTQTMPLLGGGAVSQGSGCLATDQRGYARSSCDSGAFGFNATKPTTSTITSVVTTTVTAGQPVYIITVTGSNFTSESVVKWNGQSVPTVYNNANQLTAYVSITTMASAGVVPITVDNYGQISNSVDLVVDASKIAPTQITLVGPTSGNININYVFTATVSPTNTTMPLDYSWEATDLSPQLQSRNTVSDTFTFSWATEGIKTVKITVQNSFGQLIASQTITMFIPPSAVTLDGVTASEIYQEEGFLATVLPAETELPLTYTWQATGQTPLTHTNVMQLDDNVKYTWTVSGTKVITAIVINRHGSSMVTQTVVVAAPSIFATISGPKAGEINLPYTFTTLVSPSTTLKPVTYTWQTAENTGIVQSSSLSHTATFTWPTGGMKAITVTAVSVSGTDSDSYLVTISEPMAGVSLMGPQLARVGQPYTFTATINPNSTAQPISYTWQATGQSSVIHTNGLTDTLTLNWGAAGEQVITVTAWAAGRTQTATHTVILQVAPVSVLVNSVTQGNINMAYNFTATVSPITTTMPISYLWQATDLAPMTQSAALTSPMSLAWPTAGVKFITVTAANNIGLVTTTFMLTMNVPITSITLNGPEIGLLNTPYLFTATVSPDLATQSISYTWQATDQIPQIQTGNLSQSLPFTWTSAGIKVITVTAENIGGQVTAVHTMTIAKPPMSVTMRGKTQLNVSETYTFTAVVMPSDATLPLTYNWEATNQILPAQNRVIRQTDSLSDEIAFSWSTPGVKLLTVTVSNAAGQVQGTAAVTVNVPPLAVQISGPITGLVGLGYVFTATITPDNVTLPLSYTWSPLPATGQGTAVVSYTWAITGTQTITVVAQNIGGNVTATQVITLLSETKALPRIYLPILLK